MTWISTILYFQQQDLIGKAFESREARTQANAVVDLIVNTLTIGIQLFGTSRVITRFGVTFGLIINPLLMIVLFICVAVSPVLMVLLGAQIVRRVSEYAFARPSREMLFTIVDQESKYKAKNVIDTVVYRFGDLSSAWVQNFVGMLGYGASGIAIFGIAVAAVWAWVAVKMGRSYQLASERVDADTHAATPAMASVK
jgi:ATP:ADP antiporter, AAA family